MQIEIWSDVVCPFCYIGKRRLEKALEQFSGKDNVAIIWKSFQLDPEMNVAKGTTVHEYLAQRKGITADKAREMNDYMRHMAATVGLTYKFDEAIINNTFDAHRFLHLAAKHGVQNQAKEKVFAAYYTEGKDIGDHETLVAIGEALGINTQEIKDALISDAFAEEVHVDQYQAQQIGVQGVPFFVFNNKYAVSGAQATEVFSQVLEKVRKEEKPLEIIEGATCNNDGVCG